MIGENQRVSAMNDSNMDGGCQARINKKLPSFEYDFSSMFFIFIVARCN